MVILSIYVAFQTLNGTFISYTYGCKQYHIKSLFQIIKALLLLVLVWFLTISYGVCGAAMGYLLSTIVIEPVHLWWVFSHERNSPLKNFTSDLKKRMFSLMSAVATITFMQTLILHMNSVMLMILQGARSTAIYNIATPVTQLLLSFMVFSNVFLPLAVDMAGKQEYGKLRKYAWWGMIISLLMMPIVYVVMKYSGEFLITIMFKSTYASDAAQPLLVLTLGFLLYNFGSFITQILIAMHKTRILLWLSGVTVILNIVLNYILIKAYNVTGAALATALSYLFFAAAALAAFYYCTCNAQEKE